MVGVGKDEKGGEQRKKHGGSIMLAVSVFTCAASEDLA